MNNLLVALTVLVVAGTAVADIPPPKGQKRVSAEYKITTDKEIPGYTFYTIVGGDLIKAITFDPKSPIDLSGSNRLGGARPAALVAVPAGAAKKYATEKEFHDALKARKVEGQVSARVSLNSFAVIKDTDPRTTVLREYTFEKIDPKEGIVLKAKDQVAPKKGAGKEAPEDDSDASVADAPPRGAWVAGAAAALAVTLGGLWIAGRARRKV